jgi:hypothetical protein
MWCMIGAAAEIDDRLNRGRNMDTRTALEQCAFGSCDASIAIISEQAYP